MSPVIASMVPLSRSDFELWYHIGEVEFIRQQQLQVHQEDYILTIPITSSKITTIPSSVLTH